MSSSQEDNLTIYIKHEEGRNEKPILCSKDATVHNLAEAVKKHADNFPGAFDGVRTEMVDLEIYRLKNGNKEILKPREKVVEYVDTELLFNIGCRIYLERIDKQIIPKSVKLDYNIETLDLVNQISKDDQDLGLSTTEKECVNKNERLIKIYEKAQQPGGVNIPLEKNKKLMDFNGKTLVYELTDPKIVMPLSSISDFIEVCNGQNIALFGEPGHGKSATINSLVRVIKGGVSLQISQTVSGPSKGTMACTSKKFEITTDKHCVST